MADFSPKINAIYYKNVLENVLTEFFNDNNDKFTENHGEFVLSSQSSKTKLKNYFKQKIKDEIERYTVKYTPLNPNFFFIIGSCFPKDNVLLKFKDKYNLSNKLIKVIEKNQYIKYLLRDRDIKIDIEFFNVVFDEIFNELFENNGKVDNVFFIKHNSLDCLLTYRILRNEYGRKNVINLYEKHNDNMKSILYSMNEMIDKGIKGKREYIKSEEMKYTVNEIVQFVNDCILKRK